MTKLELLEKIGDKELDYQLAEATITSMYKNYEINSIIIAYRLLYSFIIAYGFFKDEEADAIVMSIANEYSTFELSQLIREIIPSNVVEYYEKLIEVEHLTSLHVLSSSLMEGTEELEELLEETERALTEFEEKFKE